MSQPSLSILTLGITTSIAQSVNSRLLALGIDATSLVLANTPSSDAELARVVSSKTWSGVIVGYGVQRDPIWFEHVMQVIRQANPNVPLIHHDGPGDVESAIERHFNVKLPLQAS